MNISLLNDKTIEILKRAGWYPDRRVEYLTSIKNLQNEGYEPFEYACNIIGELDGLKIREGSTIYFDAYGAGTGDFDFMEDMERIVGEHIFPIAEYYQDFMYVGMSGEIYIRRGGEVYLVGNCIEESLNSLCDKTFIPTLIGNTRDCK